MTEIEVITVPLTTDEQETLWSYEQVIARGLQTFYEVGNALAAIRDDGLYRSYGTFEDYCRERWGMERRHAYRLMDAAAVVSNVSHGTQILPTSERQARPLTEIKDPDQQREVWQRAVETAPDGKVTAAHVEQTRDEMTRPSVPVSPMAVHYSSDSPEWYTPRHIIRLVVDFFDLIDLDPCSNSHTAPNVPADEVFTEADDGLRQQWYGRVYMNPPYGDQIGGWVKKLHDEYQTGNIEAAIALLPARVDTAWWNDYVSPYAVCFIRGRLRFVGADNSAPFPSALVYYGDEIERFKQATGAIGQVMTVHGRTPGDRLLEATDED